MPVTYYSSLGSHFSISSGDLEAGQPLDTFEQTIDIDAAMGQLAPQPDTGTGISAVADATSLGTNTTAQITGSVTVTEGSGATSTHANIEAYTAAHSEGDFALASSSIDVIYHGNGSYLSITGAVTCTEVEDETTISTSYSSVSLVVIDFTGTTVAPEPSQLCAWQEENLDPTEQQDEQAPPCGDDAGDYVVSLDGNIAYFDITAAAYGENTITDLVVESVVVEAAMSSVIIFIVVAIE